MTDQHKCSKLWESFKRGEPEAFRYFFHLHNCRIYYYLLRLFRDQGQAKELTEQAFILLFKNRGDISDEEHLLRRVYLYARVGYLVRLKGKRSAADLQEELSYFLHAETDIMDDPEIARNETLIALELAVQKLPPVKREIAELYFFLGLSIKAIARHLGIDEQHVKESLSQSLRRLAEELAGNDPDKTDLSVIRA